jgi:hypothetical protein
MIGTIRKHSAWLWWLVAGLTIISFVWFMGQAGTRTGNRHGGGSYGTLYGKPVTPEQYATAERTFTIAYWFQNHEFPEHNSGLTRAERDRQIYQRLLLSAKIKELGIQVSTEAQATAANYSLNSLRSLTRDGAPPSAADFVKGVLEPAGLTAADFQQTMSDEVAIEQLVGTMGLPGALIPPQEVSQRYDREHQEVSAQGVFFTASNFTSQITVTPAIVGQFYTNFMAHYRLPNQVQLNYVSYALSNYLDAAEKKIGPTNLATEVESAFKKHGVEGVPGAKTPEEAKARIRTEILRQAARSLAMEQAKQFVTTLWAMQPVVADNLLSLAASNGLAVHATAPFSEQEGPLEFNASQELVKAAFKLNASLPYSKQIYSADAVYVLALAKALPSSIPPLSQIQARVTEDYQYYEGSLKARAAATNFYYTAAVQMATGKTFAQAAVTVGVTPVVLPPFSLSSQNEPELEAHAPLNQLKQAAFTTSPGHLSQVQPTEEGGFVLYVQALLPVDEKAKASDLPQYVSQLRRARQNEAFQRWFMVEEQHELPNTPAYAELMNEKNPVRR